MSVFLVGAGPGDVDLLTLRAAKLLGEADVIVHDRLIDAPVLQLAGPNAEFINIGKTPGISISQLSINDLLVSLGRSERRIVRLKVGDPFVFGRSGEEMVALRNPGVVCEAVPGITSVFSGPLAAGIPVTHRRIARGVIDVTGRVVDKHDDYFRHIADPEFTLVILREPVTANRLPIN